MEKPSLSGGASVRYGFTVDSWGLLYPAELAAELLRRPETCAVPFTPGWLDGVLQWQGHVIPVIDPVMLLKQERQPAPKAYVLLIDPGADGIALSLTEPPCALADLALNENIGELPESEWPPEPLRGAIRAFTRAAGRPWLEFDKTVFCSALIPLFAAYHG